MVRNISREFSQVGSQVVQAAKSETVALKSVNDSSSTCSSKSSNANSDIRSCLKVIGKGSNERKQKQAEESLRTVMYLSCWGPN